ncbi:MAG: helix-turn-helix domain-containing protein [Rhodocyclaceae bacterium]|nr:helix-turn-helix domain-containing protein [Rhodocyclaceae bacterium]
MIPEVDQRSFIMMSMKERVVTIHSATELGDTLRLLRKESGLTQRDAAGLCNVSLPFLNQVEQGKPTAQIGKVLEVCQRYGVEIVFRLPEELDRSGQ